MNIKEMLLSNNLETIKTALDISDIEYYNHYPASGHIGSISIKKGYKMRFKKLLRKHNIPYIKTKSSYYVFHKKHNNTCIFGSYS